MKSRTRAGRSTLLRSISVHCQRTLLFLLLHYFHILATNIPSCTNGGYELGFGTGVTRLKMQSTVPTTYESNTAIFDDNLSTSSSIEAYYFAAYQFNVGGTDFMVMFSIKVYVSDNKILACEADSGYVAESSTLTETIVNNQWPNKLDIPAGYEQNVEEFDAECQTSSGYSSDTFPNCKCNDNDKYDSGASCVACPASYGGLSSVAISLACEMSGYDLWGHYRASEYSVDEGTLYDLSGNGKHATLTAGTVTKSQASGNGVSLSVNYIQGTTSSKVAWPSGTGNDFTICSITRWTGTSNTERILTSTETSGDCLDWYHGHYDSLRAVARYADDMMTAEVSSGSGTDWLVMCGTSADNRKPYNILYDGKLHVSAQLRECIIKTCAHSHLFRNSNWGYKK